MLFANEEGCVEGSPVAGRDETLPWTPNWNIGYRAEIWSFCSAVRQGTPLLCGPERALKSAAIALAGSKAIDTRTRVDIPAFTSSVSIPVE